ncbi:unnamed protein product [Protopolystoma xenopodis]|uniref:Uncharacterized protein n=1 Tax=Protopolystoma xenopodis TaxID=117903 RepID=A0A448XFI9_9PLAT|nr:unnamed protein product [Protopolystoma xenopodis]
MTAGNGYSGVCPRTGRTLWDGVRNFDFWAVELGVGLKNVIDGWNVSTTHWLREVFYNRAPNSCRTLIVFISSAFWHGFYPGYYVMFLTFALFTFASRAWRREMRIRCRPTPLAARVYDAITLTLTYTARNYAEAPFHLLELAVSLRFLRLFSFLPHVVGLAVLIFLGGCLQWRSICSSCLPSSARGKAHSKTSPEVRGGSVNRRGQTPPAPLQTPAITAVPAVSLSTLNMSGHTNVHGFNHTGTFSVPVPASTTPTSTSTHQPAGDESRLAYKVLAQTHPMQTGLVHMQPPRRSA